LIAIASTANWNTPTRWRNWYMRKPPAIHFSLFPFLFALAEEELLTSIVGGGWVLGLHRIDAKGYTDMWST